MAVSKYWGDEQQADAVYAVYLKKVRYVPPTGYEGLPHYRPIDPDSHHLAPELGADHLQWETIRERVIKAGSVDKLIESLVSNENSLDTRHFNVFFATYRAFTRPEHVLHKLLTWFEELESDESGSTAEIARQSCIKSILVCWTDMYPEDFYDQDGEFALLKRLMDFGKTNGLADLRTRAKRMRDRFKRIVEEGGLVSQLPSLDRYVFALGYDSKDYLYSQERAKMFDVGKENCVQIAEQLTFWDAALFMELLPYQCQGGIWGRRNKAHPNTVFSVRATIDQFNAVSQRVMTSIVLPECRPDFRAKIIEKWIDIARELRALKNFSSLKAVLSALQSESIFRLKSAWALVPKIYIAQFKELSSIFDVDENGDEYRARTILDAEGTAKSSPLKRPQLIQSCRRTKSDVNLAESQGTVPYLGSFLTDLVMVDQAHPDMTEDSLINFEKRRKEFEVLAKIKLFQSAARAYNIPMDKGFCGWFYYLPAMDENECFARSLEIERGSNSTPDLRNGRARNASGVMTVNNGVSVPKINTLSRMLNNLSSSADSPDSKASSVLAGQNSNDSGIHTEDSWSSSHESPGQNPAFTLVAKGKLLAACTGPSGSGPFNRSTTAPSTPASTISWRGGSEFNPFTHGHSHSSDFNNTTILRCDTPNGAPAIGTATMTEVLGPERHHLHPHINGDLMRKVNGHNSSGSQTSNSSTSSSCTSSRASPALSHNNNNKEGLHSPSTAGPVPVNFHLARVGLDDSLQTETSGANYKVIKVENGDRMSALIGRALEKHMLDPDTKADFCLVQLLPDGSEFRLPDHCNPFYAVAPDPTSPMLNFVLRKRAADDSPERPHMAPSAKKLNRMKRSNLLRWSSGYL
uniref:Ral guanine nucleotide dissociation stimulator-like 1 n=1 Tax=Panagrellus redivivus TaxID=6233 RepID=A0A7E4VGR1_PANRE